MESGAVFITSGTVYAGAVIPSTGGISSSAGAWPLAGVLVAGGSGSPSLGDIA